MRISTRAVFQMNADGSFTELERDSYEYNGPVALAFGGGSESSTDTTTTQEIETTTVALEDIAGIGVAAGGDIEFNGTFTDHGAVQGAVAIADRSFDFANEFGSEAFYFGDNALGFARDVNAQAANATQSAVNSLSGAIQKVGDASRSDTTETFRRVALYGAIAIAVIFAARAFTRK
jgi:hypothetical protein